MTEWDEDLRRKEKAEEARWRLKQEKAFEIMAKRDKLLGLWTAGKLGLADNAATAYARSVIETGVTQGDRAMLDKVNADLAGAGVTLEDNALAERLAECESEALAIVGSSILR